jgi:hypothetical protein
VIFFYLFLTTIGPEHYTYNIQLTNNNFNEIFLFQNSPVQPLLLHMVMLIVLMMCMQLSLICV